MDERNTTADDNGTGNDNSISRRSAIRTIGVGTLAVTTGATLSTGSAAAHFDRFDSDGAPGEYGAEASDRKGLGPFTWRYEHTIWYTDVGPGPQTVRVVLSNGDRAVKEKTLSLEGSGTFTISSRQEGHEVTVRSA